MIISENQRIAGDVVTQRRWELRAGTPICYGTMSINITDPTDHDLDLVIIYLIIIENRLLACELHNLRE